MFRRSSCGYQSQPPVALRPDRTERAQNTYTSNRFTFYVASHAQKKLFLKLNIRWCGTFPQNWDQSLSLFVQNWFAQYLRIACRFGSRDWGGGGGGWTGSRIDRFDPQTSTDDQISKVRGFFKNGGSRISCHIDHGFRILSAFDVRITDSKTSWDRGFFVVGTLSTNSKVHMTYLLNNINSRF